MKGKYLFHCFNCGKQNGFSTFLKDNDPFLYNQYRLEQLEDKKTPEQKDHEEFVKKLTKPPFMKAGPLKGLKKVSQLSPNDPLKKFVVARKIPNEYHAKLFACPNFNNFVNNLIPDKFSATSLDNDETRLLIPFISRNQTVHAFQGRTIKGSSAVKYITIILDESLPKVYGLDRVDTSRMVPVLEGPIDSMFVNNSISTAGGDLVSAVKDFDKDKLVIVYDNEKFSKETVKKIQKAIYSGYSVCIWPDNIDQKDVNDMVLSGMSSEFIEHIIKTNTYRDLAAQLRLNQWKRVSY